VRGADRDGRPARRARRLGRAGRGRVAPVAGGLRAVHLQVLLSFAASGHAPALPVMEAAAARHGRTAAEVLADLHAGDFIHLDDAGRVRAAYPFSAGPTPHVVQISGGPRVCAMCAIDALGVAAMLGAGVTITSADTRTGQPVTITVTEDGKAAAWEPVTTVVFNGRRAAADGELPGPSAQVSCGYMNFFATPASAVAWAGTHPEVTGEVLSRAAALRLGREIFGPLLADAGAPGEVAG
jgi:Alkylmercury lyase